VACIAARHVLTDSKAIDLNLLTKKACKVHMKISSSVGFMTFKHQVVPVSMINSQAVLLIETKIKGLVVQWDNEMKDE